MWINDTIDLFTKYMWTLWISIPQHTYNLSTVENQLKMGCDTVMHIYTAITTTTAAL